MQLCNLKDIEYVTFIDRSIHQEVFCKKVFLKISQNSLENTGVRVSFLVKLTLAQVLSCEFCEISINTFLTEHLWAIASAGLDIVILRIILNNFE